MTTPTHSICSKDSSKAAWNEIQELVHDPPFRKAEENGISSAKDGKAASMPVIEKSLMTILPKPKTDGTFNDHPTLEEIRQMQAKFAAERNWDKYHQPRNLLLAMVGEVGELSELFQWRGDVTEGLTNWSEEEKEHLGQELSDVLLYLIRLSEKCHIDLPQAVIKKIALNAKKYPAPLVSGSSKKYTELQSSNGET